MYIYIYIYTIVYRKNDLADGCARVVRKGCAGGCAGGLCVVVRGLCGAAGWTP